MKAIPEITELSLTNLNLVIRQIKEALDELEAKVGHATNPTPKL